jgi:hypothetical protein
MDRRRRVDVNAGCVRISQLGRSAPAQRGKSAAVPATLRSSILELQRSAGNRAVARLLQRKVGWSDASLQGNKWNADEHMVGKVRRIPLEGLAEGLDANVKGAAGRKISGLSSEGATGKSIVLVPAALDATGSIEVIVVLHGFTEGLHRPYAGWRELVDPKPPTAGQGKTLEERLPRLRQGIDASDTAPVRDVALDQVEQQLEESGQTQLVIVLPQGGLKSQFSKDGTTDFDAGRYVTEIVTRLRTEKRWRDATGKPIDASPSVRRVTMAGHSGAGAALSNMTNEAVNAKRGLKPGKDGPASSVLTGDLVIYDAINGSQLDRFIAWATMRLDEEFAMLTDAGVSDEAKLFHLQTAQKLRGFTTETYIAAYIALDNAINRWFASHSAKLGAWAGCLRANFALDFVDVSHEELMRGSLAGRPRAAGTGTILQAIQDLHPARLLSNQACPPMPKTLQERYDEIKKPAKAVPRRRARA